MIGTLIGSCLRNLEGLNVAYIPDGLSVAIAQQIVESANDNNSSGQDYAILVVSNGYANGMTSSEALKYRQDDRLAVVVGHHPNLGSFEHSFHEVLGFNYPQGASDIVDVTRLAEQIVAIVLSEADIQVGEDWNSENADGIVMACLERALNIQKELREGTKSWNVHWIEQIDLGIQVLVRLMKEKAAEGWIIDDFFREYAFACFGFSNPFLNKSKKLTSLTKSIVDALKTHWVDQSTIENSARYLSNSNEHSFDESVALIDVPWKDFDSCLATTDNHSRALTDYAARVPLLIEALRHTSDEVFISPIRSEEDKTKLRPFNIDDTTMSIGHESVLTGPFVACAVVDEGLQSVVSEIVRIHVPVISGLSPLQVEKSLISLKSKTAKSSWDGVVELDSDGLLWVTGRVSKNVSAKNESWKPFTIKLIVDIPFGDALEGFVHSQAGLELVLVCPRKSGLWAVPVRRSQAFGRPSYWEFEGLSAEMRRVAVDLEQGSARYKYVVWTSPDSVIPTFDGDPMPSLHGRKGIYSLEVVPANLGTIEVSEGSFECRASDSSRSTHSPIIAAINNLRATTENLSMESLQSIRGSYESYVAAAHSSAAFIESLGHVIAPEDRKIEIMPDQQADSSGLGMSDEFRKVWPMVSDFHVPQEIIESPEANEFRLAFMELKLDQRLIGGGVSRDSHFSQLVSKTSWRNLWEEDRGVLERYLTAYSDLIGAARRLGDPAAVFWATYPFSLSIWQTMDASMVSAILLSPLHPLRLAWLSAVESTLWHSTMAEHLAGTVEGWKFPFIGPPESEDGRLVAVPLEAGEDQVFLGWSMLVRTSIEVPKSLTAPESVGRLSMPGSASSGLNGTAVSNALRSFRRMNPHMSTITIDLASSSESIRLQEVDDAILTQTHEWTVKTSQPLYGGVRVLDSTNRAGDPPREKMARLIQAAHGVPLTWSRYVHDNASHNICNVRFLQDSGVRVRVGSKTGTARLGVMGEAPLRRFEAIGMANPDQSSSSSSPTIREDIGWEPFNRALQECEGGSARTAVLTTKLFQSAVMDNSADWTVSGEGLMSPSDIATMVSKASNSSQMLWEWRPPFLESSIASPALERRPFISVARIPAGFKSQIQRLLSKSLGREATDPEVRQVLHKLGSRGVGLSSMLSMGGTHAAGALGFYLAFELMEHLQSNDPNMFVMPIDACDSFISALSNGTRYADTLRRADLLIIRIKDGMVQLAPIEIKFYGLGQAAGSFQLPEANDVALKEALDQSEITVRNLEKLASTWSDLRVQGTVADKNLWSNGLTTLIEAAARLQPKVDNNPDHLATLLAQISHGDSDIHVGKPIIAYFRHEAMAADGKNFHSAQVGDSGKSLKAFGLLAANSGATFEALASKDSLLIQRWKDLVEWAFAQTVAPTSMVGDGRTIEEESSDSPMKAAMPTEPPATTDELEHSEGPQSGSIPMEHPQSPMQSIATITEPQGPVENTPTRDRSTHDNSESDDDKKTDQPFEVGIRRPGVKFPVGRLQGMTSEKMADFWPSNTALNQMNMGIVGDLGTGKTQLMLSLIYQLRISAESGQESPLSMLVFDYKEDFQDEEFLNAVGGKVLHINNIPLNFFQLRGEYSPLAANQRTNEFIDVLDKIYGGIGPVQRDRLSMAVMDLYREDKKSAPTIGRILSKYLEHGDKPDSVTAILRKFVNAEVFSENRDELKSFEDLIENTVIIVPLNEFGTDDDGKNALVILFLNLYYDYMLSSKKWPFTISQPQLRRLNSFLLVDEAVNIMKYKFPVLMNLLLQGRQFGFGVILASQYLSHFKKDQENYGEPLLTWFLHKVKTMTAKDLQSVGLAEQAALLAQKATNLGNHMSIYRSLGFNGQVIEDIPFYKLIGEKHGS